MVTQTTTEGRLEYPVILKPSCQKFSCPNIFLDFLFDNFSIFINLCKTGQSDGIDIKPCRYANFTKLRKIKQNFTLVRPLLQFLWSRKTNISTYLQIL